MSDVTAPMNLGVEEPRLSLPPGFRFHPTDEEVVTSYLTPKALDSLFSCVVVADVDLNKIEPWDLPSKAKMGEKEWYFFVRKDRKYPTGSRTNRATASGYWKATGKDKEIFRGRDTLVGMKKTLVFYLGRAPRGEKTPWVMHEYRLEGHLPPRLHRAAKDKWAVCRVFNKDLAAKAGHTAAPAAGMERTDSIALLEDLLESSGLPPLTDFSQFCVDDFMDFKGAAGTGGGGYLQPVKAEQQNQPQVLQGDPNYFSLPAAGYLHRQAAAGDQHEAAIRRHSTAVAPAPLSSPPSRGQGAADMPSRQQQPLYADLDGLLDYSDMWKF